MAPRKTGVTRDSVSLGDALAASAHRERERSGEESELHEVGVGRLELPASRSQSERSTRLSYTPRGHSVGG